MYLSEFEEGCFLIRNLFSGDLMHAQLFPPGSFHSIRPGMFVWCMAGWIAVNERFTNASDAWFPFRHDAGFSGDRAHLKGEAKKRCPKHKGV